MRKLKEKVKYYLEVQMAVAGLFITAALWVALIVLITSLVTGCNDREREQFDGIERGVTYEVNKQGINDQRYYFKEGRQDEIERIVSPSVSIWNFWWSAYDNGNAQHTVNLVNFINTNERLGRESIVVLWSSPERFRHPDCQGFEWAGSTLYEGCMPYTEEGLDAFEEYVDFVTSYGVEHIVVWNEAASGHWAELKDGQPSFDVYTQLLERAYNASNGAKVYVSTDILMEAPQGASRHLGTKNLLNYVWANANHFDWSLAVHPYGDPRANEWPSKYSFHTLTHLAVYQRAKMMQWTGEEEGAQLYMLATEQGWLGTHEEKANNVCLAHQEIVSNPRVLGVTHNNLYSELGDSEFSIMENDSVFCDSDLGLQAYGSTHPDVWGRSSEHYCCTYVGVGCL